MANVQISDLPFATLPLVGSTTFFEVEATEGGIVVSRRVAADDLVISATTLFINGTSTDDPSIGGGVFDGQLLWRNANAQQTGVFGFDPAGDNFIWSNDAEGGFHQIAIRDGTVLVETIAAAAGGLLVNNLLTGGGLERVLTLVDLFAGGLDDLNDVTLTAPATGAVLFKSAGDWLDTPGILIDPAADVKLHQATVEVFRTLGAAAGGAEANNTLTGGGFERVLTSSDLFAGVIIGTSIDDPTNPAGGGTYDGALEYQNSLFATTADVGFDPAGDTLRIFNRVRRGSFAMRVITGGGVEEDAYRYDGFSGSFTWLDVLNGGLLRMSVIAGNSSCIMLGGVNPPSTGAGQVGNFRMTLQDGTATGEMGFGSTIPQANLEIKNFVHGAQIRLTGEDGSGVEQILYLSDPDGTSQMYFAGSRTVVTQATGTSILGLLSNDPTTGGVQDSTIQFQNLTPVAVGDVGFVDGDANIILYNRVHGGDIILRGEDESGNVREVYKIDFENVVGGLAHIWREPGGTRQLMRLDTGVNAVTQKGNTTSQPSGGFGQVGGFRVLNRNASPETAMFVGFNETIVQTTLELKNFVHGGPVVLLGETAAGVERTLFFHDPDQVGPIFFGILDNDPAVDASIQDARMTFRNPSADNIWQIGFLEGTNDFSIKLFQDTGVLQLRGSDAASVDTLMASFDPEGDVTFFRDAAGTSLQFLISTISGITIRGGFAGLATIVGEQSDGTDLWKLGQNGSFMELESEQDNSGIQFVTRDSSPVDHVAARFNPAGDAEIFHIGVSVVATLTAAAGGLSANNTLTGGGFERVLTTSDIAAAAALNDLTDVTLTAPATGSVLFKSAGDWLNTPAITIDPADAVSLAFNTAIKLRTTVDGMDMLGSSATAAEFHLFSADGLTDLYEIRHQAGLTVFENNVNGEGISFSIRNSGGSLLQVFQGTNAGIAQMYHNALIRLLTSSQGATVRGNGANNVVLLMEGSGGIDHMAMRGESTRVIWDGLIDSSLLLIRGANSVSASIECAVFDPDGNVLLKHTGSDAARTETPANGGLEANNTLTGAGFERVLTTADRRSAEIYTPTNVSTDRAYDANATTIDELADVLGTLIADLQAIDVIQ